MSLKKKVKWNAEPILYLEKEVLSNNDKPLLSANDDQKY